MKTIELVVLIVAVTVLVLVLTASVIASDNSSFLNINFSLEGLQEPGVSSIESGTGAVGLLSRTLDALTERNGPQS